MCSSHGAMLAQGVGVRRGATCCKIVICFQGNSNAVSGGAAKLRDWVRHLDLKHSKWLY